MFFHNFKYSFKIVLKNKSLVFWSIFWPLILGTLFYMAFSGIEENDKLKPIKIGVLENNYYNENTYLKETFDELNKDNNDRVLNITYKTNKNKLDNLLDEKEITSYVYIKDKKVILVTKENGLDQTIVKSIIDEINEYVLVTENTAKYQIKNHKIPDVEGIIKKATASNSYINDISNKNMSYMNIEYYTLLAMAALYGCLLSNEVTKNYLGNSNRKGSRITLSKAKRLTLLLSGYLASFVVQLVTMGVLLIYLKFILNVDFGSRPELVILLTLIGSMAGLSLGVFTGCLPFKSEGVGLAACNIIVMLGCFLSGMMGVVMKYIVDTNIPLLNKINPANMITDGYYALYFYKDLGRYYTDIISLLITTVILLLLSSYFLRRKQYDNI